MNSWGEEGEAVASPSGVFGLGQPRVCQHTELWSRYEPKITKYTAILFRFPPRPRAALKGSPTQPHYRRL